MSVLGNDLEYISNKLKAAEKRIKEIRNTQDEIYMVLDIMYVVAYALNMNYGDYWDKRKHLEYVFLRYVAIDLIYEYLPKFGKLQLARIFKKDHASIYNSVMQIKAMRETKHERYMSMWDIASTAVYEKIKKPSDDQNKDKV